METFVTLFEALIHVDAYLLNMAASYGGWVYGLLFLIVFCETGLVVTPFLPGDSLLFAAGTLVALGVLAPAPLILLLIAAAILGDAVNYSIGRSVGDRAYRSRFIKRDYLDRTTSFFERHGAQTIVIARFVPIVRTFAPFTAGVGAMSYPRFATYNVVGAVVWVVGFVSAGWLFGGMQIVQDNLTVVMLAIIGASVVLPFLGKLRKGERRPVASDAPVA